MELQTPKGFRDFLPKESAKRQQVLKILKNVFEKYGFLPLETPALEYAEILKGKYGEEEKLIYQFKDRGDRELALRYDQTVPLARVIAQYPEITKPFKRYQIQTVWRAENTQKGRYREFLQCDIDTVGTTAVLADAEVLACALEAVERLGIKNYMLLINDRQNFAGIEPKFVSAIDKLAKVGRDGVIEELVSKGLTSQKAQDLLLSVEKKETSTATKALLSSLKKMINKGLAIEYQPTLARGLNYYTGSIFELVVQGYGHSIGGGGRYDNLIGIFSKQMIPAVGFSFGFDRLIEVMEEQKLFNDKRQNNVLVTVFDELLNESLQTLSKFRKAGVATEIYLDQAAKLDKQFKYADQKGIKFAVVIGEEEAKTNTVTLKNLETRDQQKMITFEEALKLITA